MDEKTAAETKSDIDEQFIALEESKKAKKDKNKDKEKAKEEPQAEKTEEKPAEPVKAEGTDATPSTEGAPTDAGACG